MKIIQQLNERELPLCLLFNRINHLKPISLFFAAISRLGNGVFWYVLILMLPLVHGLEAISVSLQMVGVGVTGLLIYKWLKTSTSRVRPYRYHNAILQNVPALDQFSFPSGHTLHAVGFSWLLLAYYPQWALLIIPFTVLVALSRMVLGLHYPSDVLAGAAIGIGVAQTMLIVMAW